MRQLISPFLVMSICAIGFPLSARSDQGVGAFQAVAHPLVAVSPFSGDNPALGRFLSDALLTDLAQSHDIRLVEAADIGRARNEYAPGGDDNQPRGTLGRAARADRLVVGSFLVRDKQILVNARLVDAGTGRLIEGAGANVTGDTSSLMTVVHRLAHILHRKITGKDISFDGEGADTTDVSGQAAPRQSGQGDNSQPGRYRIGEQSTGSASGSAPRASDTGRAPDNYRSSDWTSGAAPYNVYVAPQVVPVVVPYYQPIYYDYPLYYSYPYYSYPTFSFTFFAGGRRHFFGSHSIGVFRSRPGFAGHVGIRRR